MEVITKDKNEKRVRIIIGTCKVGKTGVSKPMRSILVRNTEVNEVWKKIMEALKNG